MVFENRQSSFYALFACGHCFVQYEFIQVCILYLFFWKTRFSSFCVLVFYVSVSLVFSFYFLFYVLNSMSFLIMCTPISAGGCSASYQIFKNEGSLDRTLIFRGGWWEREDWTFWVEGYHFYMKNKLKSEILNNKKKFINKKVFVCHNYEFKLGNFN